MKKIIYIVSLFVTNIAVSANFIQTNEIMIFNSVDMNSKKITFDITKTKQSKTYSYRMIDEEDAFVDSNWESKNLKFLKKGERVFVTVRKSTAPSCFNLVEKKSSCLEKHGEDDPISVIIVSKHKDSF